MVFVHTFSHVIVTIHASLSMRQAPPIFGPSQAVKACCRTFHMCAIIIHSWLETALDHKHSSTRNTYLIPVHYLTIVFWSSFLFGCHIDAIRCIGFLINYQWLAFLSTLRRCQLIQNLAPSTIVWRQCNIPILMHKLCKYIPNYVYYP